MIEQLDDHPTYREPEPFAGPDHPMRRVTRGVAFDGAWDATRARKVADLFDSMAADWSHDHIDEVRRAPVLDALDRGGLDVDGVWVELGAGTGAGAYALRSRVDRLISCDIAFEMLRLGPSWSPRVQADAALLPLRDGAADVVLLVNMLLFPIEVDRILAAAGRLIWVNTLGDQTPIHLSPADVAAALPGEWHGVGARAGTGHWTVLQRGPSTGCG